MVRLGITMGCPAGIGPDVILKAKEILKAFPAALMVLGDEKVLWDRARLLRIPWDLARISSPEEALPGRLNLLSLSELEVLPGRPTLAGSKAMVRYIREGTAWCLKGRLQGLVTGPISKSGLAAAGEPFPGHTEMLAALTGTKDYAMAFYGERLSVVLVTIHQPLKEALRAISGEEILRVTRLAHRFLKEDLDLPSPKMALAALNPHAGEGGLLGREEEELLAPAVKKAQEEGLPLSGPYPADSLFFRALQGEFHLVVALYHDQGLIPFKLLHFRDGVNLTLGLPIVRTSVDHGTAYDLAGTGKVSPESLIAAVRLAWRMATRRTPRSQAPSGLAPPYIPKA